MQRSGNPSTNTVEHNDKWLKLIGAEAALLGMMRSCKEGESKKRCTYHVLLILTKLIN